jgi:hypothetical protein
MIWILVLNTVNAQTEVTNGGYKWIVPVVMVSCDISGEPIAGQETPLVSSLTGQKFSVVNKVKDSDSLVIRIWNYPVPYFKKIKFRADSIFIDNDGNETKSNSKKVSDSLLVFPTPYFFLFNYDGTSEEYLANDIVTKKSREYFIDHQRYFKVSREQISHYAKSLAKDKSSLALGAINFPFKFRPQKGRQDFTSSLNMGVGIGFHYSKKSVSKWDFATLLGYGVSAVQIDSNSVRKNKSSLPEDQLLPALTLSFGQMIQYQDIQIGIFVGMDRISASNQYKYGWRYQGNPWLSIGFGLAIFHLRTRVKAKLRQKDRTKEYELFNLQKRE